MHCIFPCWLTRSNRICWLTLLLIWAVRTVRTTVTHFHPGDTCPLVAAQEVIWCGGRKGVSLRSRQELISGKKKKKCCQQCRIVIVKVMKLVLPRLTWVFTLSHTVCFVRSIRAVCLSITQLILRDTLWWTWTLNWRSDASGCGRENGRLFCCCSNSVWKGENCVELKMLWPSLPGLNAS